MVELFYFCLMLLLIVGRKRRRLKDDKLIFTVGVKYYFSYASFEYYLYGNGVLILKVDKLTHSFRCLCPVVIVFIESYWSTQGHGCNYQYANKWRAVWDWLDKSSIEEISGTRRICRWFSITNHQFCVVQYSLRMIPSNNATVIVVWLVVAAGLCWWFQWWR